MRMAAESRCLSRSYPAIAASVAAVRYTVTELASAAGATDEQLDGIRLAVSEAITNVVTHAYGDAQGRVEVTAAVVGGELMVLAADDGCRLLVRGDSPGLGLGLRWMAQLSDDLTVLSRPGGGLEVRLRFGLGSTSEGAGGSAPRGALVR